MATSVISHSSEFKRVKMVVTIGPSTHSYASILELIKSGANGIRLNFSHGTHEEKAQQIKWVRKASKELKKPVAIIQDIQGPKIRLGDFEGIFTVSVGQSIGLQYNADFSRAGLLPTQYDLSKKVKRGHKIYFADGKIRTVVTSVSQGIVYVRSENEGILIKRKSINLPDTDFEGDILTAKDKKDISFGAEQSVDYVAASFVQSAQDIVILRNLLKNLGSHAKIIAKIETKPAVDNLEAIVQEADVVMVARGDLAIETEHEYVPILQRMIIGFGRFYATPVIVATHMMASMTDSPEPTRAEVSDVATAALMGADCVMLSDETASGKYPVEAVRTMKIIIRYAENNSPIDVTFKNNRKQTTRQAAIFHSIIDLVKEIKATAIVAETKSGATAMHISAYRPDTPIVAVTSDVNVANQLSIVYGVKSYVRPDDKFAATKMVNWLSKTSLLKSGDVVVMVSGRYPGVVGSTDTIKVRVLE